MAAVRYEFRLAERLSETALQAFPELAVAAGHTLRGAVRDQTHLHGLLARFQTLGLTVLELRRLPD